MLKNLTTERTEKKKNIEIKAREIKNDKYSYIIVDAEFHTYNTITASEKKKKNHCSLDSPSFRRHNFRLN